MTVRLFHGDCLDVMRTLDAGSVDAVICDPPYGLSFMGKGWDHGVPGVPFWEAALRVAKPGAMLLAFGGTRTFHRLTVAIEDAGWEVRDCLMWLYGSGFPKGRNQLKPAWEPIIMARKPLQGTVADNVQAWGTGGINIDQCRIGANGEYLGRPVGQPQNAYEWSKRANPMLGKVTSEPQGRWPANLMLDEEAAVTMGEASRYFYVAKASKRDRDEGLEGMELRHAPKGNYEGRDMDNPKNHLGGLQGSTQRNHHPTVKPTVLMRYLCRLVTPPNGVILDPFMGSGSTGKAAMLEGFRFVGIELEADYLAIAERRIAAAQLPLLEVA